MKKLLYILFLLPILAFGQYDFDTRYFKIDATALPAVEESVFLNTKYNFLPSAKNLMNSFRMNTQNYRQPVDMMEALYEQSSFATKQVDVPALQQKTFGFSVSVGGSNSLDGTQTTTYRVRNIAYQEMRSVYFCSPNGYIPNTTGIRN